MQRWIQEAFHISNIKHFGIKKITKSLIRNTVNNFLESGDRDINRLNIKIN